MDVETIKQGFVATGVPADLAREVIDTYVEGKRRFHLGDHRPQEVEGGRFSEAVFRVLQHHATGSHTPLRKSLPSVDQLMATLEASTSQPDSLRLHIPRTLKLIYDIRNKRDAAHLADGIDPNLQDATLVVGNMDWVLAELVRLNHNVDANAAQRIIEDLVTKEVPAIQEIDGQPVILSRLQPRDQALLMLYRAGAVGASLQELASWLRISRIDHLRDRLTKLDRDKLVLHHPVSKRYHLTDNGIRDVQTRRLADPVGTAAD